MRLLPLPGVFQPHSDSLMLAGILARERLGPGARVLDLCTGSGLLAVLAARLGAAEVVAVDVSRRAVLSATINAGVNGVAIRAFRGDLFGPVGNKRFDLIVSNPPYLPSEPHALPSRGLARAWEGGQRGRAFIDRICREACAHLRPGGVLLLVHSAVCGERETIDALSSHGLEARVAARNGGPLGKRMRARARRLREEGLLGERDYEEIVVIRGTKPT